MLRAAVLLSTVALASAAPDPAPLDAWLRAQAGIRSLESEFVQERRLPSLRQPVTTKGRLWFRRPGFLRWELGQPAATIALADGQTLTIIDTIDKRARRLPINDPAARPFTLLAADAFHNRASFRQAFALHDSQVVAAIYQATLRPLDRHLRAKVPWIIIDIDTRNSRLRAMELHLADDSRIRSVFSESRINPPIPDERFTIDLSGYQIR